MTRTDYVSEPSPKAAIQQLADDLMKCVLSYKETREERFLADMQRLSTEIRAHGYHPYFIPKSEILIVSLESLDQPTPQGHFDA